MSRSFTSKPATTSRGRGRGTNSSNFGRGSIINRGEKKDEQLQGASTQIPRVGQSTLYSSTPQQLRGTTRTRGSTTTAGGRGQFPGVGQSSYNSTPNRLNNSSRGTTRNRGSTTIGGARGQGRGATMYNNDLSSSRPEDARMRANSQSNPTDQQGVPPNNDPETNQDRTTHTSGFTMVSPNEKKRRAITEQATKNLQEYERHKEERRIQHVSYVGTAGGGLVSEEEARRKAAIEHSKASYNSRIKRESYRAAEKEKDEMVYRDRKMAARRQSELNEERREKEEDRLKDDMRRKNAAFLDRLEANKPKPTPAVSSNQDTEACRSDVPVPTKSSGAKGFSPGSQNYVTDAVNEDLNRLQVMFPYYTRNDLCELLQQMGTLQLTIDILSD